MATERGPSAAALFLIATLLWGTTWYAIKFELGVVAPEISVVYRFATAGALLMLWCAATRRSLAFGRRDHVFLAALGVLLFGLNYSAIYLAEAYATSGLVAVVFSTIVFMSPIGMRLAFGTPLSARVFVAATLGVVGVALLFLPELVAAQSGGEVAIGIAYALAGTLMAAAGNLVAVRNQRAGIPTFTGTAWGMLYGALSAALAALAHGAPWAIDTRPAYWIAFAYLVGGGSIAAFGAYLTLLKRVGAGPSAFVSVVTPIVALTVSTLLEDYRWTFVAVCGVVLAVGGNLLMLPAAAWRRVFTRGAAPPRR